MGNRRSNLRVVATIAAAGVAVLTVTGAASGRLDRAMGKDLLVTKTAKTSWERVNTWTVSKTVDPSSLELSKGSSGTATWHVDVTKTGSYARNATVSGTIKVSNPDDSWAVDVSVTDSLPGAVVDCGGGASSGLSIQGGKSITCSYTAPVGSIDGGTNTASAAGHIKWNGHAVSGSGSADYAFGEPTQDINASVSAVDDENSWSGIRGSSSFSYDETFDCSSQGRTNVVRLLGDNPDTPAVETDYELGTDSATVTVHCGETPPTPPTPPSPPQPTPSIDLQVEKSATPQVELVNGQAEIAYTLKVRNNGPNMANHVVVDDPAPTGVTFVAITKQPESGSCTITPALLSCDLGDQFGKGVERTIGFTATVGQTGTYKNCATVSGDGGETSMDNNLGCAETLVTAPATPPVTPTPPVQPQPKPKPHPKPKPKPDMCRVLRVNTKLVKANGHNHGIVAKVTRSRNPVKGVKVRFTGAGVSKSAQTNAKGVARITVRTTKAGIIRVHIVNRKACNTARIGVVGVFQPPVTG